jgi:hypothetical protein
MNTLLLRTALRLGCAVVALAGPTLSQGETASRSVRAVPQPAAPAMVPGAPGPGAPSAAGLPSPIPDPAGLTSRFPAGLPAPGTSGSASPIDVGVLPQTNVVGAAGYGGGSAAAYGGVATPRPVATVGPGPYTALQVAQSFLAADGNRDGELTRLEAQRLTILPSSFEEMDRNHDGILTRFEYEDAMR